MIENRLRDKIKGKSKKEIIKLVNELNYREIINILYDWEVWARLNQLPPDGNWLTWLILAGRGWG